MLDLYQDSSNPGLLLLITMLVEDVSGNWFMSWDELKLDKEALTGLCWGLSAAVEGGGAEPKGGGTTVKFEKKSKIILLFFFRENVFT